MSNAIKLYKGVGGTENVVQLFPDVTEPVVGPIAFPVIEPIPPDSTRYVTSSGLTMTSSTGIATQSYLFVGTENSIQSFNSAEFKRVVEVDKVASIASIVTGTVSATSLGAYIVSNAIIIHPLISSLMLISSVVFLMMSKMKR